MGIVDLIHLIQPTQYPFFMIVYLQLDSISRRDAFKSNITVASKLNAVTLATVAPLPNAPAYTPVTQLLTQTGAPAALLLDATAVTIGSRVLVKDQVDSRENGVYVVVADNPWQLRRASDFDSAHTPIVSGTAVPVTGGATLAGTTWVTTARIAQLDPLTDPVSFVALAWSVNSDSSPTDYRVEYRDLNTFYDTVTKEFREHCKKTPDVLSFWVDACVVSIPGGAYVNRPNPDGTTSAVYLTEEPYVYVDVHTSDHSEGNRFITNNAPGRKATFIVYTDKFVVGTNDVPPAVPAYTPPTLNSGLKWLHFKSCMRTNMRLPHVKTTEWFVRIYDRYGNDIVITEDPAAIPLIVTPDPPRVDPMRQTMVLLGLSPEYANYQYSTSNANGCNV